MKTNRNWLLLALILSLLISGCAKTNADSTESTQPDTTTEEAVAKVEAEYSEDGSISITRMDKNGQVIQQITYDVSIDTTVIKIFEYDENGCLIREIKHLASGNLVEEFAAGNYAKADISEDINYESAAVDLENAFVATIEELAPLYTKAEEIWNTYGVAVLIADKVSEDTYGAEFCYEYDKIETSLAFIESCIKCYPEGFFKEFPGLVYIQLVGSGSTAGSFAEVGTSLQIQLDVNNYNPSLGYDDKGYFFSYTLHHEISHMICHRLLNMPSVSECLLTEEKWNSYNPDGFEYANRYDSDKEMEIYDTNSNYKYFIDSYGCSSPDEDRATIFGNAMTYYQGYEGMKFTDEVNAKLQYLSDCICGGFGNEDWAEVAPWEYIMQ